MCVCVCVWCACVHACVCVYVCVYVCVCVVCVCVVHISAVRREASGCVQGCSLTGSCALAMWSLRTPCQGGEWHGCRDLQTYAHVH